MAFALKAVANYARQLDKSNSDLCARFREAVLPAQRVRWREPEKNYHASRKALVQVAGVSSFIPTKP